MSEPPTSAGAGATVGAVVVAHGADPALGTCLDALVAQCDEVVVIDNLPDADTVELLARDDIIVHSNDRPVSFAHNVNHGVALLETPYVAVVNPDAIADPECIATLVRFLDEVPSAGVAAPQLRWPDGTPQPTGRAFPSIGATLLRRSPLRRIWRPFERQERHYRLDQTEAVDPWSADWLLGAFWIVRRETFVTTGGLDVGYRMYVEDIDFCARLAAGGSSRWVVPAATAVHEYQAVIDRRFVSRRNWWHVRGMVRFLRRHPALVLSG